MYKGTVIMGVLAALALATGCGAFEENLSPLDANIAKNLPTGSCSEAGLNFNTIGENQNLSTPVVYSSSSVGDGTTITAIGDNACIFIQGSVGANVKLRADGKNATIIVYGQMDPSATAYARGQNALVRIDSVPPDEADGRYSVMSKLGGKVYVGGSRIAA